MKRIILIYTSMTGNTELMAKAIKDGIVMSGVDITVIEAYDAAPEDLLNYEGILIGTHTWDDGEIPDEFMVFYEELDQFNLSGKKAAVFGSGDSFYGPTFGEAIHLFSEKLQDLGADLIMDNLLIDLEPNNEELERCKEFGRKFAEILNNGK